MSELPMRGHFRYLGFKTFPMTPRTPQCEVFFPLLSSSEHSGVPEDSQPPTFPSVGLHPHTWPKWGCDIGGKGNYLITPIPRFGFGAIFGVMPHFIVIETHSFWLPTNIPLGLVGFKRSPLLDKSSFGFETQALKLFRFFPS